MIHAREKKQRRVWELLFHSVLLIGQHGAKTKGVRDQMFSASVYIFIACMCVWGCVEVELGRGVGCLIR